MLIEIQRLKIKQQQLLLKMPKKMSNQRHKFKRRARLNQKRRRQLSRRQQLRTTKKKPKQTTRLMARKRSKLRILETKMKKSRLMAMIKKRTRTQWLMDLALKMSEERVSLTKILRLNDRDKRFNDSYQIYYDKEIKYVSNQSRRMQQETLRY